MSKKRTNSTQNGTKKGFGEQVGDSLAAVGQTADFFDKRFRTLSPRCLTFAYIPTGRRFDLNYEPQTGVPVDGANPLYRLYSPFVLQYLPPADAQPYLGDMAVKADMNPYTIIDTLGKALKGAFNVNSSQDGVCHKAHIILLKPSPNNNLTETRQWVKTRGVLLSVRLRPYLIFLNCSLS